MPSVTLLLFLLLAGQAASAPAAPGPASVLEGVWEGTMTNVPFGKCSWTAAPEEVRVVLRPSGGGTVDGGALFVKPIPPGVTDVKNNLTVRINGDKLRIEHERTAQCGQSPFKREYRVRLEGPLPSMVDGKRMLVLEGQDVPCIKMGCHFGVTLSIEWKGPLP